MVKSFDLMILMFTFHVPGKELPNSEMWNFSIELFL